MVSPFCAPGALHIFPAILDGPTPLVFALAVLGGTAVVFDAPNRQALVYQLVGRAELPNAVALNSSVFNSGRVIGPAIATSRSSGSV